MNDKTSFDAVILRGQFTEICLPSVVYHGTSKRAAERILIEGLHPDLPEKQSALSNDGVYLITDPTMAAHMARSRATRKDDEPVVLAIKIKKLDPDQLSFDLNMSGRGWSESLAYGARISPKAISKLPKAAARAESNPMILGEPAPGEKPLAFELGWSRAPEFLAVCQFSSETDQAYQELIRERESNKEIGYKDSLPDHEAHPVNLLVYHAKCGGDLEGGTFQGDAVFFATDPHKACTYAEHVYVNFDEYDEETPFEDSGVVIFPVLLTLENPAVFHRALLEQVATDLKIKAADLETFIAHFEDSDVVEREQVFRWAREKAYDGAVLPNDLMPEYAGGDWCFQTSFVSFYPEKQVRFALCDTPATPPPPQMR